MNRKGNKIEGLPCIKCGGTLKYKRSGKCVPCFLIYERARYYKCKAERQKYARERKRENPDLARKRRGLPAATRPAPSLCECCGDAQKIRNKSLCLDHCHHTQIFRGWLCDKCNLAIGLLGDTLHGVSRAITYLARSEGLKYHDSRPARSS